MTRGAGAVVAVDGVALWLTAVIDGTQVPLGKFSTFETFQLPLRNARPDTGLERNPPTSAFIRGDAYRLPKNSTRRTF